MKKRLTHLLEILGVKPPILETLCAPRWVSVMGHRGSHLGGSRWVGIWIAKKRYDLNSGGGASEKKIVNSVY